MQMQPTQKPTATKSAMLFIFSVILLDVIGLTILMPVSAYIVREFSADALSVTLREW